jgi:hypothetical protein
MSLKAAVPDLIKTLAFIDWQETKRVQLRDVPRSTTLGEALGVAARAMGLPSQGALHGALNGRQLSRAATLQEVEISEGDEIRVLPEVSAG